MSDKKKDTKTIIATALDIINGYAKKAKKITALDLTTKEGEKIVFKDVEEGNLPKAGDTATIDGEPVVGKTVTIVDNDGEFTITFDEKGEVVQEQTEEQKEIEALKAENAELKATVTAMANDFKATLSALQGSYEEEETDDKKNDNKAKNVTASLDDRLNKLKEKKARRGTIV